LLVEFFCWLHFFPSTSHEFPLSKTHERHRLFRASMRRLP
jgi:hypothetical protein